MRGSLVRLDPLAGHHTCRLLDAADRGRGSYAFTQVPGDLAAMREYVEQALREHREGRSIPYAVLDASDDRMLGTTRFMNVERWSANEIRPAVGVTEIGYTWLAADAQGTGANVEAKLLMLDHAFGELDMMRVAFMTDARNKRSRRSIERIGAEFEGIRRAHMPAFDGGVRDSAFYSMLRADWPRVREALAGRVRSMGPVSRGDG